MALPRRGDPRRPLRLAVRSCRVLGVLTLLVATCALAPLLTGGGGGPMGLIGPVMSLAFYGGVGAAFLIFAHYMVRRQKWALIAAIVLTSIGLLLTAMGAAAIVVMLTLGAFKSAANPRQLSGILWGTATFEILIAVALGQVVYWLARSFPALGITAVDEERGFDVLPVAVLPSEPTATGGGDGDGTAR